MKIAYIIPTKKSNQNCEAEKNARELALKLEEKGHSVIFTNSLWSLLWQNFDIFHFIQNKNNFVISLIKIIKKKTGVITTPIPAGINLTHTEKYNHIKELGLIKNSYLLFAGKITKSGGALFLAETFKRLEDKHLAREKKLIIAAPEKATGEYAKELKDSIRGRENIVLLENVSKKVLEQLLSHCYFFVEPSGSKKLSSELLEAMSCGAATLVSATKENLQIIGEDAGFSFCAGDSCDAENKITILINSPLTVKSVKEKARAVVEQRFSLSRITTFMENIYADELMQKKEKIIFKTYEKNI